MSTAISPTAYNYKVVRQFAIMTVVWGILGMGLGVFIASQLVWPELNFGLPWTSFGRLRPLHTNLVIFAFGGWHIYKTKSPTGSISPSSSPSRCCTSATTPRCPSRSSRSKSYVAWAGVQDAMFQWWYGHNAVGFFLTAGFLAIMYYFIPKRPSGRSIPIACRSCTSGR
jgi:cbb3-type cytochrome oxidase subunit 1